MKKILKSDRDRRVDNSRAPPGRGITDEEADELREKYHNDPRHVICKNGSVWQRTAIDDIYQIKYQQQKILIRLEALEKKIG